MRRLANLEIGRVFHIYNRGNNGESLFKEERNYYFFLKKYIQHVVPYVDTYAYCLLDNHFHLVVRIKYGDERPQGTKNRKPHQAFSNWFNCYSQAINKSYNRTGSLFEKPFHRKLVLKDDYLKSVIVYVHSNPIKHGFCEDYNGWIYSSYHDYLDQRVHWIDKNFVLDLFGGKEGFITFHK